MRYILTVFFAIFLLHFANAQKNNDQKDIDKIKEELTTLFQQLNTARVNHDRAALERIYAKEFIDVHSAGFVDEREETIAEIMSTDSIRPLPMPSLEGLILIGDIAILRKINSTAAGTINTSQFYSSFIYARRDGRWQIVQGQGTPLQKERKTIKLDNAALSGYTGKYERSPGQYIIVEQADGLLTVNVVGRGIPKRKLMAVSDTQFFDKLGTEYNFSKDEKNTVISLTTRLQNGQESKWERRTN
jgi:hypothetical protein